MATPIDSKKAAPVQDTPDSAHDVERASMSGALEDRSQYIRTMAKDMAKLSNTPQVAPSPRTPAPEKQKETVEGVTLDVAKQPFFERQKSREERNAEEPIALPSIEEAAQITTSKPIATPQSLDAERSAVLERLRQKVGESAQMSIQQSPAPVVPEPIPAIPPVPEKPAIPVPTPEPIKTAPLVPQEPVSAWSNIPSPAPAFAPVAEPVPSRIPPVSRPEVSETYREPIEAYVPPQPAPSKAPEALHTYTSDFSDRIDTQSASTFSVLAAEQDAQAKAPTALTQRRGVPKKAILAVGSGILLIVLAGTGIFFTYQFVMTMRDTPIAALTVPSIVFADEYRELEGTGTVLLQSLQSAASATLVPGNVLVTYILTSAESGDGSIIKSPAGGNVFVRALQVPAPDILLRNIAEQSTVGVINSGGDTSVFFALRVDSYERTYAGMLTWEPLMARDLAVLYPLYPVTEVPQEVAEPVATTTASTTVSVSTTTVFTQDTQAVARTRFEDTVVANRDVRVLRDARGRSLLLYGYADKRTLLIARDEQAFEALLARLKTD